MVSVEDENMSVVDGSDDDYGTASKSNSGLRSECFTQGLAESVKSSLGDDDEGWASDCVVFVFPKRSSNDPIGVSEREAEKNMLDDSMEGTASCEAKSPSKLVSGLPCVLSANRVDFGFFVS